MAYLLRVRLKDPQKPGIMWGVSKWVAIPFSIALASMASLAARADDLQDYAQQCDAAIGATVQDFDCDAGTEVGGQGTVFAMSAICDEPNRLNKKCDPGSRFQVLHRSENAYVVAHCRKEGGGPGEYSDIAVIQYSRKNGATCFYQALGMTHLPGGNSFPGANPAEMPVKAPSNGLSASFWMKPSSTANIGCGGCHDNGPFIRSPYINQVSGKDQLPGSNELDFNRNQPYAFVGKDFALWKAFKVEIAKNECNSCHRLGVNNVPVNTFPCSAVNHPPHDRCGTALDFAERATSADEKSEEDTRDAHKTNPPSPTSPIWMPYPPQPSPNPIHAASAKAIHDCALHFRDDQLPDNDECRITQFAGAYLTDAVVVINGATQSPPSKGRSEGGGDLGACYNGGGCPLGFCYFGTLHGPLWQSSPSKIAINDAAYHGSWIRIYGEGGKWKYGFLSDLGRAAHSTTRRDYVLHAVQ